MEANGYDALYYKQYYAPDEEQQQQQEDEQTEEELEEDKPPPVLPPAKYGDIVVGVPLKKMHPYQRHISANKVVN
jgi:hypothetical protein